MQLRERIAEGAQAEIFALGEDRVVKLFRPGWEASDVAEEARKTAAIAALGFRTPRIHDVVEIDGRCGFVMERVIGPTLLELALADPDGVVQRTARLVELQARLHALECPDLPRLEPRVAARLMQSPLSAEERAAALRCLDACPRGDAIYHGDFHPGNVLSIAAGLCVIDWFGAARAHPAADVAQSYLVVTTAILPASLPAEARARLQAMRPLFDAAYLDGYLALTGARREDVHAWIRPLAAARLAVLQPGMDGEALLAFATGARSPA